MAMAKAAQAEEVTPIKTADDLTEVGVGDLIPCQACCCAISSCFCVWPDCFGCKGETVCCCCVMEGACCKIVDSSESEDRKCCVFSEGTWHAVKPGLCCYVQEQCCCFDVRYSIPCKEEVPCICTILPFCTVVADYKCKLACMKKVGEVIPRLATPGQDGMAANAPPQVMMGVPSNTE